MRTALPAAIRMPRVSAGARCAGVGPSTRTVAASQLMHASKWDWQLGGEKERAMQRGLCVCLRCGTKGFWARCFYRNLVKMGLLGLSKRHGGMGHLVTVNERGVPCRLPEGEADSNTN